MREQKTSELETAMIYVGTKWILPWETISKSWERTMTIDDVNQAKSDAVTLTIALVKVTNLFQAFGVKMSKSYLEAATRLEDFHKELSESTILLNLEEVEDPFEGMDPR